MPNVIVSNPVTLRQHISNVAKKALMKLRSYSSGQKTTTVLVSYVFFVLFSICTITPAQSQEISDPLEPINRGIFWFNDKLDVYFLEPVTIGYDFITPQPVQNSVTNFFRNLNFPIYLVSDLLQLNFTQAGKDTTRFLLNTFLGFYGTFDVAEAHFKIERVEDDLGIAFGRWGVPFGPYIVLPLLGASSVRDGIGFAGESFLSPTIGLTYSNLKNSNRNVILFGSNSLQVINIRSRFLEPVRSAKEATLDYYSFVKQSFYQSRYTRIHGTPPPLDEDFDDDFGFENEDDHFESEEN
jgi:phospholipid-binding lipoprotein MlaA